MSLSGQQFLHLFAIPEKPTWANPSRTMTSPPPSRCSRGRPRDFRPRRSLSSGRRSCMWSAPKCGKLLCRDPKNHGVWMGLNISARNWEDSWGDPKRILPQSCHECMNICAGVVDNYCKISSIKKLPKQNSYWSYCSACPLWSMLKPHQR